MTMATPTNEVMPPTIFAGVKWSEPAATARKTTRTGVDAMMSAESPAGTIDRPVVHRIWYSPKPSAPSPQIAMTSRRGRPIDPSRQRSSTSSVAEARRNRRNVKPTGGSTASADFTTMKLAAHRTMTTRTAISASRRSACDTDADPATDTETPAGDPAGVTGSVDAVAPGGATACGRSILGPFAVELEKVVLLLLGDL